MTFLEFVEAICRVADRVITSTPESVQKAATLELSKSVVVVTTQDPSIVPNNSLPEIPEGAE